MPLAIQDGKAEWGCNGAALSGALVGYRRCLNGPVLSLFGGWSVGGLPLLTGVVVPPWVITV